IYVAGDRGTYQLIILSQVILSMQLPFAVIPLIRFTSDRTRMGEFASAAWVKILAWGCAAIILVLNFKYVADALLPWVTANPWRAWMIAPPLFAVLTLLMYVSFTPQRRKTPITSEALVSGIVAPVYRKILVPLDH